MSLNLDAVLIDNPIPEVADQVIDAVYQAPAPSAQAMALSLDVIKPSLADKIALVDQVISSAVSITIVDDASLQAAVSLGGDVKRLAKSIDEWRTDKTKDAAEFVKAVNGYCRLFIEKLVANDKKTNAGCAETVLKQKVAEYRQRIEMARRIQEEQAAKAARELQARLDREAEEANRKAREEAARLAEEETKARLAREAAEREKLGTLAPAPVVDEAAAIREAQEKAIAEANARAIVAPDVIAPTIPKEAGVVRTESGAAAYDASRWVAKVVDPSLVPEQYKVVSQKLLDDAVKEGVREIPGCKIEKVTDVRFRK